MDETFEIQQAGDEGTSPGFGLGAQEALEYRRQLRGMIGIASKVPLKDRSVLSLVYTPGVAAPCLEIAQAPLSSFDYTMRGNTIALVSDGSSAFGLGNIGPLAALKIVDKKVENVRVVINGAGPGGIGIAQLLLQAGFQHILICDRLGIIDRYRLHNMNWAKVDIARQVNPTDSTGTLADATRGADVVIGLSSWNTITPDMVRSMAKDPILFVLAVPKPEITPEAARAAGAAVVATGRMDAPNLITNALILPGIFRGAMDVRATGINQKMLIAAAIEAYPICLAAQDIDEIVAAVEHIAPAFGGVNLEDISAPRCFEVEKRLQDALSIPIFHDDQHGTATVTLAGLMNALRLVGKYKQDVTAVLMGPGAAGVAVSRMLLAWGIGRLLLVNRGGILRPGRTDLNPFQLELASLTNPDDRGGTLADALRGADIFIGVSGPGMLTREMVQTMAPRAIVFALANPVPEILPEEALAAGAQVVATGRSDYPNQVNNSLAFPGLMRGALDVRAHVINDAMKLAAAECLASLVSEQELEEGQIIPLAMNYDVAPALAAAVAQAAMDSGVARLRVDPQVVAQYCHDFIYEGRMAPIPPQEDSGA
jgi:malate dehydrogenase (oxaloacetate-decarboxylating)